MIAAISRLDRRFTILRGKRVGAFDRDQYYLERAVRARVARKFRQTLREMRPIQLVAPRWSAATAFLDEVGIDVQVGHPSVRCRLLSVQPLEGRPASQAWAWVCRALADLAGHPPIQVGSSGAYVEGLGRLFALLDEGPPACLIMHDIDAMAPEAVADLMVAFASHVSDRRGPGAFNLVLSGPPGLPMVPEVDLDTPPFERVSLPDFDPVEAVAMLAGYVGADHPTALHELVRQIGGVPEILLALTRVPRHQLPSLAQHREALWGALGQLGSEVRSTVEILLSDAVIAERLHTLAHHASVDHVPGRDAALVAAGLVQVKRLAPLRARSSGVDEAPWSPAPQAFLRSPLFRDLVLA